MYDRGSGLTSEAVGGPRLQIGTTASIAIGFILGERPGRVHLLSSPLYGTLSFLLVPPCRKTPRPVVWIASARAMCDRLAQISLASI